MQIVSLVKLSNFVNNNFVKRKQFTTTINEEALKRIKILAINLDRSVNDLFEESIEWLLKKYEKQEKQPKK